jgi:hypothetical protein
VWRLQDTIARSPAVHTETVQPGRTVGQDGPVLCHTLRGGRVACRQTPGRTHPSSGHDARGIGSRSGRPRVCTSRCPACPHRDPCGRPIRRILARTSDRRRPDVGRDPAFCPTGGAAGVRSAVHTPPRRGGRPAVGSGAAVTSAMGRSSRDSSPPLGWRRALRSDGTGLRLEPSPAASEDPRDPGSTLSTARVRPAGPKHGHPRVLYEVAHRCFIPPPARSSPAGGSGRPPPMRTGVRQVGVSGPDPCPGVRAGERAPTRGTL